jgi:hypothetical protein
MRRSLSTAIDRGALSLSKWAEFPTAVSTAVYRGIPFADIPVQRGGAGRRRRRIQRLLPSSLRAEATKPVQPVERMFDKTNRALGALVVVG